jgi:hypothetical protein
LKHIGWRNIEVLVHKERYNDYNSTDCGNTINVLELSTITNLLVDNLFQSC